jgi:hypothetical protein
MRFEVRYPTGEPHEVELQGTLAVLGRDPSCDLVLNDVKCSRRHAVVEAGPDGLAIRDTESANGVFVNGRKVGRATLNEGDLVRLGEIVLRVLPEQITGTVVMGPEDLVELGPPTGGATPGRARAMGVPMGVPPTEPLEPPAPAAGRPGRALPRPRPDTPPRPPAAPERPRPEMEGGAPLPARPLTVQVLSALWLASIFIYAGAGLLLALRGGLPSPFGAVSAVAGGLLAVLSAVMAYGIWTLRPWARLLQIGIAAIGLLDCPMTLASATVLVYMLRKGTAVWFSGRAPGRLSGDEAASLDSSSDMTFALTVLAMAALGAVLTAVGAWFGWPRS